MCVWAWARHDSLWRSPASVGSGRQSYVIGLGSSDHLPSHLTNLGEKSDRSEARSLVTHCGVCGRDVPHGLTSVSTWSLGGGGGRLQWGSLRFPPQLSAAVSLPPEPPPPRTMSENKHKLLLVRQQKGSQFTHWLDVHGLLLYVEMFRHWVVAWLTVGLWIGLELMSSWFTS